MKANYEANKKLVDANEQYFLTALNARDFHNAGYLHELIWMMLSGIPAIDPTEAAFTQ